jgi:hypothetical protein
LGDRAPVRVFGRALLRRHREGLALGACELADEAELVPERVLHHGPIDQWSSTFVRVRRGVHRWRVLRPAADRLDLRDRGVDVLDADVDVGAVRRRIGRRAASTAPESALFLVATRCRMISCFQVFSSW